ncbi:hypothetical protein ACFVH4_19180 [Nocardia ignorata]|uniref:hypothetical protein n=1 Tax=Nocardia ignorata TaxID=145285 RepID=UPI003631A717
MDSHDRLTRCQGWILQSLCAAAATAPVTAEDLGGRLNLATPRAEEYLQQLADKGLALTRGSTWRPSSDGRLLGCPV